MTEQFKDILNFPNYQISNYGNVYSKQSKKIIPSWNDGNGYRAIHLWKNNRQYTKKIHRLVAEAFISNPNNYRDVNHKDENKENNIVFNLEWITHQDNLNYGTHNARANITRSRAIYQLDKTTQQIIGRFNSIKTASELTGVNKSDICQVCLGRRKYAGNFIWKYAEEEF